MKSVVICGSRRFKKEIREWAAKLRKAGIVVYEPILHEPGVEDNNLSEQLAYLKYLGLTLHHFSLIRKAEVVFVYNKEGYSGVSTTLEIGFAAALGKTIHALSGKDEEGCRRVLFDEVVKSPKELIKKLK